MSLPHQTVNWSEDHRPDMAVTQPDAAIVHLLELLPHNEVPCRKCNAPLAWVMVAGSFSFADCQACGSPYTPNTGPAPHCRRCHRDLVMMTNGPMSWLTCPTCVSEYQISQLKKAVLANRGLLDGSHLFKDDR